MTRSMTVAPIVPSDMGFGEWQVSPNTLKAHSPEEAVRFLTEFEENRAIPISELSGDDDIRGLIRNEPTEVYAYPHPTGEGYGYFGVL